MNAGELDTVSSGALDGAGQAVEDTWILNGMWPNRRDLHAAIKCFNNKLAATTSSTMGQIYTCTPHHRNMFDITN